MMYTLYFKIWMVRIIELRTIIGPTNPNNLVQSTKWATEDVPVVFPSSHFSAISPLHSKCTIINNTIHFSFFSIYVVLTTGYLVIYYFVLGLIANTLVALAKQHISCFNTTTGAPIEYLIRYAMIWMTGKAKQHKTK